LSQPQQPTNNNHNQTRPRLPFFVKPGALATRFVQASKSFLGTFSGSGGSVVGLDSGGSGNGIFGGYRPSNANFTNLPISRFRNTGDYLGAYSSIASVYICVNTIANSIAGLPTDFIDQTGKTIATLGQKPAEDNSLAALLEHPNPYQDWYELKETLAAHLELCGNAILLMDNMDGLGRPECLYPLNPAYIKLAVSPDSGILGYIYEPGGTSKRVYEPDEILHFKMSNPSSIFWGQGTLQALAGNLNTEIDISDSVQALYQNGAVIPGAFVAKEHMTDPDFARLKEQLLQEHTGISNFFKPLLLDGGLDWKSMSIGHTDLGTTDIRNLNREEIFMGFGVPISEAGHQGRANVKNDHLTEVFWLNTIAPKTHRFEGGFKKLTKRYDPRYSIKFPLPIKVAEAEMLDNVIKVDKLTSLSNSEKRKAIKTITGEQFGWGDIPDEMPQEAADARPQPQDIRETLNPQNDPKLSSSPAQLPTGEQAPTQAPTQAQPEKPGLTANNQGKALTLTLTEDAKAAIWQDFDKKATGLEKEFASEIEDALTGLVDDFLSELDLSTDSTADTADQGAKALGISLGIQKLGTVLIDRLHKAALPHITQAVIAGYLDATLNHMGPTGSGNQTGVAKEAKARAAQMAETVWKNTKDAIAAITENTSGKSQAEQIKEIRNLFDSARAATIAGTETVSALNYGKLTGFDAAGQKSLMWVTRRDGRVRHTHAKADGQVRQDGKAFEVGGYELKYPGDPDAPAKERVMCRCTLAASTSDDNDSVNGG
jgi:HK97 family phage portal protein